MYSLILCENNKIHYIETVFYTKLILLSLAQRTGLIISGSKLNGYWNYYEVCGNFEMVYRFYGKANKIIFKWLNRRSQRKSLNWQEFNNILIHYIKFHVQDCHSIKIVPVNVLCKASSVGKHVGNDRSQRFERDS